MARKPVQAGVEYALQAILNGVVDPRGNGLFNYDKNAEEYYKSMDKLTGHKTYTEEVGEAKRLYKQLPLVKALTELKNEN